MGAGIAHNLLNKGYALQVFARQPAAACRTAAIACCADAAAAAAFTAGPGAARSIAASPVVTT